MIDLVVKTSLLAAVAGLLTRRVRLDAARDAHRVWLLVLVSPLLFIAVNAVLSPVAFVVPRIEVAAAPPPGWTLIIYGLVASALLLRVGAGLRAVGRLLRGARRLPESDLVRLRALAGDRSLEIRESDLVVPVTAGAFRPCIILPRGWRGFGDQSLSAILRHEAAHVRRRDCAIGLAAALIEAAFWFNPAVWAASARVRWFAEMASDAEAARQMGLGRYAGELLELAAGWAGARSPRDTITAGAETQIGRRIRLLIDATPVDGRHPVLFPLALAVMIIATPASALVRVSGWPIVSPDTSVDHGAMHRHAH